MIKITENMAELLNIKAHKFKPIFVPFMSMHAPFRFGEGRGILKIMAWILLDEKAFC